MNFGAEYFTFVILSIILKITSVKGDAETFELCPNLPTNLETVDQTVYFNGCSDLDYDTFSQICSWKDEFSSDVLSITLKVGGELTFENDEYICWDNDVGYDCTCTFQHACLSQLMDQATFLSLMCCTVTEDATLEGCITEFGVDEQLEACMNGETDIDPIDLALCNAQEILDQNVDLEAATEPFNLFCQTYDQCSDFNAYYWWVKSICSQLTQEKFDELDICQEAFAN